MAAVYLRWQLSRWHLFWSDTSMSGRCPGGISTCGGPESPKGKHPTFQYASAIIFNAHYNGFVIRQTIGGDCS